MDVSQPIYNQNNSKSIWYIYVHPIQYGRDNCKLLLFLEIESFLHNFVFSKTCLDEKADTKDTCGFLNGHFISQDNFGLGEVPRIILDVINEA